MGSGPHYDQSRIEDMSLAETYHQITKRARGTTSVVVIRYQDASSLVICPVADGYDALNKPANHYTDMAKPAVFTTQLKYKKSHFEHNGARIKE